MSLSIIILITFLLFYLGLEILTRKFSLPVAFTRKVAHLASGVGAILASRLINQLHFLLIVGLFIFLFTLVQQSTGFKSLHLRHRKSLGIVSYPVGIFILAATLYHRPLVLTAGLLILAVPDVLACSIGETLGKSKKTIWGSLTYFFSSILILTSVTSVEIAVLFASILTLVEYFSIWGLDNLTVPLAYYLLGLLLQL